MANNQSSSFEDTCNFTCDTGYELTSSSLRVCQADGSWSGSPVSCTILKCPSSSLPVNSILPGDCNETYKTVCELQCEEGFSGNGNPLYVCDVSNNGALLMWTAVREDWSCQISGIECVMFPVVLYCWHVSP